MVRAALAMSLQADLPPRDAQDNYPATDSGRAAALKAGEAKD